jgi:hypothetical protein
VAPELGLIRASTVRWIHSTFLYHNQTSGRSMDRLVTGYIGLLLVPVNFVLAWTAICTTRKEPIERLVNLIKAVRRR